MSDGTALQNKFHRWMKELGIYCCRFYDARSMGRPDAPSQPADFWIWIKATKKLIFVECKDYEWPPLPFTAFTPSQYKAAIASEQDGILYIALVELRNKTYASLMSNMIAFTKGVKRKSWPEQFFKQSCFEINKKEDLLEFLNEL